MAGARSHIHVSEHTLQRLSGALKLDRAEREHLFLLAHHRPPPGDVGEAPHVGEGLLILLQALESTPAHVRTSRLDILAWNATAARVFVDWAGLKPHERNSMRLLFLYPPYRDLIVNWEEIARRAVGTFRAAQARAADPAPFQALAEELEGASAAFAAMWRDRAVQPFGEGAKRLRHPSLGRLDLEHLSLVVEDQPELCVVAFLTQTQP